MGPPCQKGSGVALGRPNAFGGGPSICQSARERASPASTASVGAANCQRRPPSRHASSAVTQPAPKRTRPTPGPDATPAAAALSPAAGPPASCAPCASGPPGAPERCERGPQASPGDRRAPDEERERAGASAAGGHCRPACSPCHAQQRQPRACHVSGSPHVGPSAAAGTAHPRPEQQLWRVLLIRAGSSWAVCGGGRAIIRWGRWQPAAVHAGAPSAPETRPTSPPQQRWQRTQPRGLVLQRARPAEASPAERPLPAQPADAPTPAAPAPAPGVGKSWSPCIAKNCPRNGACAILSGFKSMFVVPVWGAAGMAGCSAVAASGNERAAAGHEPSASILGRPRSPAVPWGAPRGLGCAPAAAGRPAPALERGAPCSAATRRWAASALVRPAAPSAAHPVARPAARQSRCGQACALRGPLHPCLPVL